MPRRLILIAHAETSVTRLGVFPTHESLAPRGCESAAKLVSALPAATNVLTSPAVAARETAEALGLDAEIDAGLADIDVGSWAGRSLMDIGATDAESASAWIEDPAFAGHGGESFEMLIARVGSWLAGRGAENGITIAVTHAAVLRAAAIAALGADSKAFWRIEAPPLAQLTLGSDGTRWVMRELKQGP